MADGGWSSAAAHSASAAYHAPPLHFEVNGARCGCGAATGWRPIG